MGGLLDGLLKGTSDCHDLSNRLHGYGVRLAVSVSSTSTHTRMGCEGKTTVLVSLPTPAELSFVGGDRPRMGFDSMTVCLATPRCELVRDYVNGEMYRKEAYLYEATVLTY